MCRWSVFFLPMKPKFNSLFIYYTNQRSRLEDNEQCEFNLALPESNLNNNECSFFPAKRYFISWRLPIATVNFRRFFSITDTNYSCLIGRA